MTGCWPGGYHATDFWWSFFITGLTFQVSKINGGWWVGWWPVGLYCQPQSNSFFSGLWILDFGLGFGTGLGLDNKYIEPDSTLCVVQKPTLLCSTKPTQQHQASWAELSVSAQGQAGQVSVFTLHCNWFVSGFALLSVSTGCPQKSSTYFGRP